MINILLVSNMYPSNESPFLGTFVKNSEKIIASENNINIEKVVIDRKGKNAVDKIYNYIRLYILILKKLFCFKYDYIYAHYASHVALPIIFYRFFNRKIKIIVHVHGGDVKKLKGFSTAFFKLKSFLSGMLMSRAFRIISPSCAYKIFIYKNYNVISKDAIVVYPSGGIEPNVFSFDNTKRNIKTIGYAGRLIKSKNVDLIIKSLLQLPDYSLEIVGDGQELTALTNLVKELNLEDVVRFLPAKSQQELAAWYQTIDCLVYPSESESLGLVPIEAMSCGVFCVLSDIPAFRELLDAQLNIELMRSLSPISISDSVKQLETWSEDLRFQNSIRVQELYSSEKVKKELLSVFQ
ncbi:glycosyltransferase family 4 protein [Vibrio cholerae]|nr:glycosyltransferase family 4 protein [Vibrio cholerae]ELA3032245.1 glycosyltransferase family 4 protein [Vibrio cholerae]ELK1762587.1 glycosyltransferase family 4 protein [Vibrio cholerae]ELN7717702.1 glycosyltransferase family 4 protein [Vibrio cholerae]